MRQGVRVLVVEDHANVRRGLCLYLSQHAAVGGIATAEVGERAVVLARAFQPDLALVDLRLPGEDGLQTIRGIRGLGEPVSIVAISADFELRGTALDAGADSFVDKIDLARRLDELLAGARNDGGEGRPTSRPRNRSTNDVDVGAS